MSRSTTSNQDASTRTTAPSAGERLPLETGAGPAAAGMLAMIIAGAWLALLLAGILVLRLPGATVRGNELSLERCVFTAANAATLSGFQQTVAVDQYGPIGQVCIVTLTVAGTLAVLLIGALGLVRLLRMPYSVKQVIRATLVTYVFAVAWGGAVLAEPGRSLLSAMVQAASAFGNSGIFLGRLPGVADWRTPAALLPLAVLGGLSIPVLMEAFDAAFGRRAMSKHTVVVLSLYAAVYLAGLLLLSPWDRHAAGETGGGFSNAVATGSALAIDGRTAGFPLVAVSALVRPQQWLLILFMLIGAAPAAASGGMNVTALYHAFRGTRRALRREPGLRITGIAAVWIFGYLLLVLVVLLALLATLPDQPADRLVFLAASSVGTVGLAHDPISVTGPGLFVLSAAMLLGRAAPLLVLWWAARTCEDADVAV